MELYLKLDVMEKDRVLSTRKMPSRSLNYYFIYALYNIAIGNAHTLRFSCPGGYGATQFAPLTGSYDRDTVRADHFGIIPGFSNRPLSPYMGREDRYTHGRAHVQGYLITQNAQHDRNDYGDVYGGRWRAINVPASNFNAFYAFAVTRIRLPLFRVGSPGPVTVGLRAGYAGGDLESCTIDGNALPTEPAWIDFVFASPKVHQYTPAGIVDLGIVLRAPNGDANNYVVWRTYRYYYTGSTPYSSRAYYSDNSGGSWSENYFSNYRYIHAWEHYGDFDQLEFSSCNVLLPSVSGNTAEFSVQRDFTNKNNGLGPLAIREVMLYGMRYRLSDTWMVARDLITPEISLGYGQTLRVTYTLRVSA
jgi:hypothetical protein